MMSKILSLFTVGLFQNTLRTATPVVLSALGGLFTEQAGLMNIGMDGIILIGAFTAVVTSYYLSSAALGLLFAIIIGVLIGLFFGLLVIRFKADEFIIGVALNIFAGAVTVFLLRTLFNVKGSFSDPKIVAFPKMDMPWLENIPYIGQVLNDNSILVYVSWFLVALCWIVLYKTPFGLRLRAAGEKPDALKALGKSPIFLKYVASVICGAFCAMAGAHLALGYLTQFAEGMSANRGFIAYACIIFGKANPPKVFLAVLLFGFLDALGMRLQDLNISSNLTQMIPYLATIFVIVIGAMNKKLWKREKQLMIHETER